MVPASSHRVSRVPWYSGSCRSCLSFAYGAFTLFRRSSQFRSATFTGRLRSPKPQGASHPGLGSSGFARRYFRNRVFFLFLRLLRCFSSPGSLRTPMDSVHGDRSFSCRVSPFRYLRIIAYLRLPAAFRSLSRLSSAPGAKASAPRPSLLNLSSFDSFPFRV